MACQWNRSFYSSRKADRKGRGCKPFDVNLRAVIAFREVGKGHNGIETFCGYMNMPPPMQENAYNDLVKDTILPIYKEVLTNDILEAANDLHSSVHVDKDQTIDNDCSDDEVLDIAASFDGTWQRRGYASLNGVVTAISIENGKCLAYECLYKNCKSCEMWNSRKGTEEYEKFHSDHSCPINHEGSAAAMEASGVVRIYEKSMKDLKVHYMTYIGDGDSKAYHTIQKAEPYGPNKIPTKGECTGHVQKRVGTRLRKFKKENGQNVLSDGKKLGGVGRLTEKWINKLQNYYGLAIRQNTNNLLNIRKAVGAVLYHSSEASTTEARHQFCDTNSEWCKMRMAEKSGEIYVEKPGLPAAVRDKIMPIFRDLSKLELLEKCLHGKTQNNNEGLNAFIWKRIPKDIYVGAYALEMGVCSAIMNFNSGACRMLDTIHHLHLRSGKYTKDFLSKRDAKRINKMKRKMSIE